MSGQDRQQFVRVCECGCGQPTRLARQTDTKTGRLRGTPSRFVYGHGGRVARPLEDRLWPRINAMGVCWEYTGYISAQGYGVIAPENAGRRTALVHRVVWELLVGPIPPDMTLDHLCRNRACCCPEHLEVVTHAENTRRGYSPIARNRRRSCCKHGHPFTEENTYYHTHGGRQCRTCEHNRRIARTGRDRAERTRAERDDEPATEVAA